MLENHNNTSLQKNLSVLITGGSGFIGKYLTKYLLASGYKVSHLSRTANSSSTVRAFLWNPEKRLIDHEAFEGINFLIHLAGTNIGEKRWTRRRKEKIMKSRVDSARFLYETIKEKEIALKAFISASATGFYGSVITSKIFYETDPASTDFLGSVCKRWEEAADLFENSGIRTVKIRSAVVLEKNDSALSKMMMPAKFGFLMQTGDGQQYTPWIHINDLCRIYLKAIQDPGMRGAYNAVAPQHVTHKAFMHILAKIMKVSVLPVALPGFVLRFVFGEMSDLILKGSRVSCEKIINSGYSFLFSNVEDALENIVQR